ncbi:hypothetical protein [Gordonia iterans]|nr:hypothetical protein [Gordonia iterans]
MAHGSNRQGNRQRRSPQQPQRRRRQRVWNRHTRRWIWQWV